LIAAAEQEVDTTPMEGFDPEVDKILGLSARSCAVLFSCRLATNDPEGDWLLRQ
jgi:hypothetical protein